MNKIKILRETEILLNNLKGEIKKGILACLLSTIGNGGNLEGGLMVVDSDTARFNEIRAIEEQLSELRTKFKSSSTMIKNVQEKYDVLDQLISIQINAVDKALKLNKNSIEISENALTELNDKFKAQFSNH